MDVPLVEQLVRRPVVPGDGSVQARNLCEAATVGDLGQCCGRAEAVV